MSEQGRKQEDCSTHKSSRTNTAIPQPPLGSSPSLLTYSLQPAEYTPHHRLYTMMRPGTISMAPQMAQPMQTAKPCLTNEMGPPIFMPSLNLGTPRSSSASTVSSPLASSPAASSPSTSSGPNPSVTGSSSGSGAVLAHSMSDMILSNAPSVAGFHTLHPFYPGGPGIRPGSGQPQYMSIPTTLPQASAVASNKRTSVSTTTMIAKPTPMQTGHGPKVGTFVKTHPGHPPTSKGMGAPPTSKAVMLVTSSSGHTLPLPVTVSTSQAANFSPGSSVIKQPSARQTQAHHHLQQQQQTSVALHQAQQSQSLKQKVYINTAPDSNPDSIPPVFFAHSTMQGHMISLPYQAMIQTHGIPGNVQPGGHPPSHPPPNHPVSSTLTELLAPASAVVPTYLREGGGKQGKMHDVGMRPYSPGQQHHSTSSRHGPTAPVRERSSSGDTGSGVVSPQTGPGQSVSHTTSAQPTPTAAHTDTRLERPAQPSSGSTTQSSQLPSPQNMPSYQGPHRERSNSSEVSNIIISMPGLTGRHIAAISGNQPPGYPNGSQPQAAPPQPSDPYRGSRIKSEYSGGGGQGMDSSPVAPPHPTAMHVVPQSSTQVGNPNTSLVGAMTTKPSVPTFGQLAEQASPSLPSHLTATVVSSSSSSVNSPGGPHPNSLPLSAASGSPLANLSPSRRPGIIRKRPHESSWKVDSASSPTLNKASFGSSIPPIPPASPGHAPRGDHGPHPSHPLSPPISTHSHHGEPLTNHITAGRAESNTGEILPSPRKKRRKQDVVVTDDQYASNVPNNIRADVTMTMDEDHFPSSPRHQSTAVTMVTRARGRTEDPSHQREERVVPPTPTPPLPPLDTERVEVRYLSQLRQSQWPINGMYRMHHRAANNHFKRHADIKHNEMEKVTATGIANNKTSVVRASGWKMHRLDPQIEDMLQIERDILETMLKVEASISNLMQCASCYVPTEVLSGVREIVQGNVARSNRIISHLDTTKTKMVKLLEHKPTVMDLLHKFSTAKHPSPINSLPHKIMT